MDDAEIKSQLKSINEEIIRLRDRQHAFANQILPILTINEIDKELKLLRTDMHNLIPEVAKLQVYSERIPQFSSRFGELFKSIGEIEKLIERQATKLYALIGILTFFASAIFAVLMKFLF